MTLPLRDLNEIQNNTFNNKSQKSLKRKFFFFLFFQSAFLDSILGAGLTLYVSETWLSQVYRGIRHQDILGSSGLSRKLLRGPMIGEDDQPLRGSCLVEVLIEFDGIGWSFDVSQASQIYFSSMNVYLFVEMLFEVPFTSQFILIR